MDEFDVVIVGSGFGGSVAAYRLAKAGRSVCLLERGAEHPPGTFARRPRELRDNFWDPSASRYGLFDLWSFAHMDAVLSAGLGGGSLIYANVLLRKDEKWFVRDGVRGAGYDAWPVDRVALDPYYAMVEKELAPTPYPYEESTPKTQAMREAAVRLGIAETKHDRVDASKPQFYLPPLAITFARPGEAPQPGIPLPHEPHDGGVPRQTCRLCGECDIGCNFGAKNTLDLTYLRKARKHGACIRALCEVRSFAPLPSGAGFVVRYLAHEKGTSSHDAPESRHRSVRAKVLILAAGTLGTTFLLLQDRAHAERLGPALGTRFSGNGDLLCVSFETRTSARASGRSHPRVIDATRGPVITSTFRFPDSLDCGSGAERGFYLQDAGYPELVDWILQEADLRGNLRRFSRFATTLLSRVVRGRGRADTSRTVAALLGSGRLSYSTLTLLGMGRDVPSGRLHVRGRHRRQLALAWERRDSRAYYAGITAQARRLSDALEGHFVEDPLMQYLDRSVTVHPVGGVPMGHDATQGVVDEFGRTFAYDRVYVADGSIMPGPIGANPSLTIAAMAERIAESIAERFDRGEIR